MLPRERAALRLPVAQVADRAVNEDDRRPLPLIDIGKVGAVCLHLLDERRFLGLRRHVTIAKTAHALSHPERNMDAS